MDSLLPGIPDQDRSSPPESLSPMGVSPITLHGRFVRLEPLTIAHSEALGAIALDPELWRWTVTRIETPADVHAFVEQALKAQANGDSLPFVTVEAATGHVVGSTRFMNISTYDRRAEIGYTWVARPWQRTPINTEAKYLMLCHAFETWHCQRVELKTDMLNERSRTAIARLGAIQEGIFRNHMIVQGGRTRHTVWFSIITDEWPGVKSRLETMLAR